MKEYKLNFPLDDLDGLRHLKAGDIVTLGGTVVGLRDATLMRMFDNGVKSPIDMTGAACMHTAPVARKVNNRYEKVCIGPTTSIRMNRFTEPLLKARTRAIIGKAGLLGNSLDSMKKHGGCYFSLTGGAAALTTLQVDKIEDVYWEDLMPEALWRFKVSGFGPLIVSIDSHGNSLYEEVKQTAEKRFSEIVFD